MPINTVYIFQFSEISLTIFVGGLVKGVQKSSFSLCMIFVIMHVHFPAFFMMHTFSISFVQSCGFKTHKCLLFETKYIGTIWNYFEDYHFITRRKVGNSKTSCLYSMSKSELCCTDLL